MQDTFDALACAALADVSIPPERHDVEVRRLASIMDATAAEGRAAGLPDDEIKAQVVAWGDLSARLLRTAAAATRA